MTLRELLLKVKADLEALAIHDLSAMVIALQGIIDQLTVIRTDLSVLDGADISTMIGDVNRMLTLLDEYDALTDAAQAEKLGIA